MATRLEVITDIELEANILSALIPHTNDGDRSCDTTIMVAEVTAPMKCILGKCLVEVVAHACSIESSYDEMVTTNALLKVEAEDAKCLLIDDLHVSETSHLNLLLFDIVAMETSEEVAKCPWSCSVS